MIGLAGQGSKARSISRLPRSHLFQIDEEIISLLVCDPNANVNVTLEINADFPADASDQIDEQSLRTRQLRLQGQRLGIGPHKA